jgi:hypothetical protein
VLEITNAERTAWQRRAVSCLGELLKLAAAEHLPVLTWRIGTGPSVLGESLGSSPAERRAGCEAGKAGSPRITTASTYSAAGRRAWSRAGSTSRCGSSRRLARHRGRT